MSTLTYNEQIKILRDRRGPASKERQEQSKAMNRARQAVLKALDSGPKTVPEIAEETGLPTQEVFWWIAALRKYNFVQDEKKRSGYMSYGKK